MKDFSYESMFRYLKCALAAAPEEREMCDRMENYCLALESGDGDGGAARGSWCTGAENT